MAKTSCKGRGGYRGAQRAKLNHVRRMVPHFATIEFCGEAEELILAVKRARERAKGKTTRNYVELNKLLSEIEHLFTVPF